VQEDEIDRSQFGQEDKETGHMSRQLDEWTILDKRIERQVKVHGQGNRVRRTRG
jgi:hypothetical protein